MAISLLIKKQNEEENSRGAAFVKEVRDVVKRMQEVNALFNMVSDEDMVERYIHELRALEIYYHYLLKQAKENNIICPTGMIG